MIVFESEEELQRALLLLNKTFERFHLQINVGKTKTMVVNFKQVDGNQSYPDKVCNLNGNPIENVQKRKGKVEFILFKLCITMMVYTRCRIP